MFTKIVIAQIFKIFVNISDKSYINDNRTSYL